MKSLVWRLAATAGMVAALMHAPAFGAIPTPAEDVVSKARIHSDRQRAVAEYAARDAACKQRFVVASCLNEAAATRRKTLERLQEEEAVINERQRAARADVAAQRVADKKQALRKAALEKEAAARAGADKPQTVGSKPTKHDSAASAASAGEGTAAETGEAAQAEQARKPPTPSKNKPTTSHVPTVSQREKAQTEYERRLEEAAKHRQEVEARNAVNAAKKKPGAPLPSLDAP